MLEPKRPLKVFLSYASQDKPAVRELSGRLAGEGWIDPWLDEKKLLPGQDWRTKIEEAVETSDIVIICLSSNSVSKEGFVQKELRYAREIAFEKPDETIFLIPLRLDDCTVPRGLRFYQWGDYFGEQVDETYSALLESLKVRYEQKLRIEEELARQEKEKRERETAEKAAREEAERDAAEKLTREKAEREAAEKAAREKAKREAAKKAERENAEKAAREKLEREAAEKARREKAERDAAEKAAREKARHEAAEKAKRERTERQATRKVAITKTLNKSFIALKSILPKARPLLRIVGFIGTIIILFWVGSWAMPQIPSVVPTAKASVTPRPIGTTDFTNSPSAPTSTLKSVATPTKTRSPTPIALPTEITDAKGVSMVLVPEGEFTMSANAEGQRLPYQAYLNTFYVDKYEVTNAEYQKCVSAQQCSSPSDTKLGSLSYYGNSVYDSYPVVWVTRENAEQYCGWRDAYVPSEEEWEKAARGNDQRSYPWGNQTDLTSRANGPGSEDGFQVTAPVGSFPLGISPYGAFDMAGNVSEFISDNYVRHDTGYEGKLYPMTKGGDWYGNKFVQSDWSGLLSYDYNWIAVPNSWTGFRCARDANP